MTQYGGRVSSSSLITPELRAQAWRDADDFALRSRVVVRLLTTIEQFDEARRVFDDVWPTPPGGTEISAHLTKALVHAGGYVGGAYADDRIIGATLGVVGRSRTDAGWHTHMHSHVAAVLPDFADRGVGAAMKIHQRAWALENDLDRIDWTYDPLVRRNAKFNIAKLGGRGVDYIEDFYGPMSDAINANDRSDRIVLAWDIASDRVAGALAGGLAPQPRQAWLSQGAQVSVEVGADGEPVSHAVDALIHLVALPRDIVEIRQADPEAALRWRLAVRVALQPIITAGGRLVGLTQEGDYVVEAAS
jgi:predicted GNAT superfamily acetyltransferase